EHLPAAWAAAGRWRALAPGDREADALYAAVALKLYHTTEARTAIRDYWRAEEHANSAGAGGTRPTQPDGSAGDRVPAPDPTPAAHTVAGRAVWLGDRKSTRLNSSHVATSYAVFCLKKKKRRKRRMSTRGSDDGIRR